MCWAVIESKRKTYLSRMIVLYNVWLMHCMQERDVQASVYGLRIMLCPTLGVLTYY